MSTAESAYNSLLQGVSQQIPKERLPGQLTAQLNMLSDPVTNLRRRPGVQYKYSRTWANVNAAKMVGWFTDIAGTRVHVLVNCASGQILLLDENHTELALLDASDYLTTNTPSNIRAATVGDEFFIMNKTEMPSSIGSFGAFDPATAGFFYVVAGSFSRAYTITLADSGGTYTVSYTTPSGAGAGDAALATPEYIATRLYDSIVALGVFNVYRVSSYVFLRTTGARTNLTTNTSTGSAYMIASKQAYVTQAGSLPAQLPAEGNGFICKVGDFLKPQYFRYDSTTTAWLECGAYGSPTGITNMPISISKDSGGWYLKEDAFEGRTAGDEATNEDPRLLEYGITGIGTFQGRLVLLSGPMVRMSASNKPRRLYRSTITSVVADDPIDIGSSMNSSASYEYAIPFQKDLVLFSSAYQALVPSNNQVVTPVNATVVPTSSYATDTGASPVSVGRTMMYPAPRSEDFFGAMELIPSPYTDAQYVSQDSTVHLPKYFGGRCRFTASSSVAGMAMFAPSGDPRSLVVHEYQWDGDQKVQQAWHTWTFPYDIATAYFSNDVICMVFAQNNMLVMGCIDPRVGVLTFDAERRPFLDLYSTRTITDRIVTPPAWMLSFDPAILPTLQLAVPSGTLAGDKIGFEVDGSNLKTAVSFSSGSASVGIPFRSSFAPTPPIIRDYKDIPISTNKATLLRYILGTKNSSEFKVLVQDVNTDDAESIDVATLYWSSSELELDRAKYSTDATSIIPCRTNINTTTMEVFTEDSGELNITSLEYVLKYNQKIKRR